MNSENQVPCKTQDNTCQTQAKSIQLRKPRYTISEKEGVYSVRVELPGVSKDAAEVEVKEGKLVIRGSVTRDATAIWTSRYGEFAERDYKLELRLNEDIDTQKIAAELTNGVLLVELPKVEAVKPLQIAIS